MPPAEPTAGATVVAPSMIAGRGVFAAAPRAAGDEVLTVDRDITAVEHFGGVNHSCDPNLGWSGARSLVALRDVAAGDELTVDYSTAIDDEPFVLYCHCGTTRCRQAVEGRDWQIPQLQRRYAGRWTPRLQQLIDNLPG